MQCSETKRKIKIQLLENLEDLEILMRGDAVNIIYQNEPLWKYGEKEQVGAYHGKSEFGFLQFLIPAVAREDCIIMYETRKSQITIKDGKIVLNEDKSVTTAHISGDESFQDHQEYETLNETLAIAELR
ncbi:hypothetical protein HYU07_06210 [Candidatus Woesearchaeota archaeon]|nr:hypothetical protein [Candidatus Woesearchaeota archaeon]